MAKMGRPGKYETHVAPYLDKIIDLRREGYNEAQIAKVVGISPKSLLNYKKEHQEFQDALLEGERALINNLERTLYQVAMGGYEIKSTRIVERNGEVFSKETSIKEAKPETSALIFALKNLDSSKWRDRRETEMYGELKQGVTIINDIMSEEENEAS